MFKTGKILNIQIYVNPLFPLAVILAIYLGFIKEMVLVFAIVALHEAGHVTAASFFKVNTYSVEILPIGLQARIEENPGLYYIHNIIIYAAGPIVNLVLIAVMYSVNRKIEIDTNLFQFFITTNACLACFNLFPALPLDGGKILWSLLMKKQGYAPAARKVYNLSLALAVLLTAAGIWQLVYLNYRNFSLLAIGLFLVWDIKNQLNDIHIMSIRDLIYRKQQIADKGIYPVKELAAIENITLGQLIRRMEGNNYHIIRIVDKDLNILKTITEKEIMDALMNHGIYITLKELLTTKNVVL